MRTLTVRLQFVTPCLGNDRGAVRDSFMRDPGTNRPIFLNSWWQQLLGFGAHGLNKYQMLVEDVFFDIFVEGTVKLYRRYYRSDAYTVHEAFLDGEQITVTVRTPDALPPEGLRRLLEVAGRWRGFSPYGWRKGFGRFVVVEVITEGGESESNDEGSEDKSIR